METVCSKISVGTVSGFAGNDGFPKGFQSPPQLRISDRFQLLMEGNKVFGSGFGLDGGRFPDWRGNRSLMHAQPRNGAETIEAVDPFNDLRFKMLEFQCERARHPDMESSTFAFRSASKPQRNALVAQLRSDNRVPVREDARLEKSALTPDRAGRLAAFCADGTQATGSFVRHVDGNSLMACGYRAPEHMLEGSGVIDNDPAY